MVIGVNSSPTETPNVGYSEEANLVQCKQLNCDKVPAVKTAGVLGPGAIQA